MKQSMLILTGLFFNRTGNQSLYETVRHYSKSFNVTIISSAILPDNSYLSIEEARQLLPGVRITLCSGILSRLLSLLKRFVQSLRLSMKSKIEAAEPDHISNGSEGLLSRVAFAVRVSMLVGRGKKHIAKFADDISFLCAYEIVGLEAAQNLKQNLKAAPTVFGKFQGTVLGSVVDELPSPSIDSRFSIDIRALSAAKFIEGCIMTNDGTRGKEVLEKLGVDSGRILFIANGVSNVCQESHEYVQENKVSFSYPIRLFTLSRLVYWKRVELGPRILSKLVNEFGNRNFRLNIYGGGTAADVSRLTSTITEYGVTDYVEYHGAIPYKKTPSVFANNDILISLYIMNNITNPVLEAVFLNIPVMTIYKPDLAELIGEKAKACIMLKDSQREEEIIQEAAEQLNAIDSEMLEKMHSNMRSLSTNIVTWDERASAELEFIRNLRRSC